MIEHRFERHGRGSMSNLPIASSNLHEIREWLHIVLGPAVALLGFYWVQKQAHIAAQQLKNTLDCSRENMEQAERTRTWKRTQYLASEIKSFYEDPIVCDCMGMFDWYVRPFSSKNSQDEQLISIQSKDIIDTIHDEGKIHDEFIKTNRFIILSDALSKNESIHGFSIYEMEIRDKFDWTFYRLGHFNNLIIAELYTFNEIEVHLGYCLDLLSGYSKNARPELVLVAQEYMRKYDFPGALALIGHRRWSKRDTAMPSHTPFAPQRARQAQ